MKVSERTKQMNQKSSEENKERKKESTKGRELERKERVGEIECLRRKGRKTWTESGRNSCECRVSE